MLPAAHVRLIKSVFFFFIDLVVCPRRCPSKRFRSLFFRAISRRLLTNANIFFTKTVNFFRIALPPRSVKPWTKRYPKTPFRTIYCINHRDMEFFFSTFITLTPLHTVVRRRIPVTYLESSTSSSHTSNLSWILHVRPQQRRKFLRDVFSIIALRSFPRRERKNLFFFHCESRLTRNSFRLPRVLCRSHNSVLNIGNSLN